MRIPRDIIVLIVKIARKNRGGLAQTVFQLLSEHFSHVVANMEVFELTGAGTDPTVVEALNLREQSFIALFLPGSLNTQIGRLGVVHEASADDPLGFSTTWDFNRQCALGRYLLPSPRCGESLSRSSQKLRRCKPGNNQGKSASLHGSLPGSHCTASNWQWTWKRRLQSDSFHWERSAH